ncbi:hypothetical protein FKM82_030586 [Ascaphus truei]
MEGALISTPVPSRPVWTRQYPSDPMLGTFTKLRSIVTTLNHGIKSVRLRPPTRLSRRGSRLWSSSTVGQLRKPCISSQAA